MLTLMYTATKLRHDSVKPKLPFPSAEHSNSVGTIISMIRFWAFCILFYFAVLDIDRRTFCMLRNYSTTELPLQSHNDRFLKSFYAS